MKKFSLIILISSAFLGSCDEGRIYETAASSNTEGFTAKIEAEIINSATWPSAYTVSIAAFEAGNDYALVAKSIGAPSSETGRYELTLANIPAKASTVEICVVNRLRQRIATFYTLDINNENSPEVRLEPPLDADMFETIQDNVFSTTCANCHGGSSFAAVGLYLTKGKSYENLVGVESVVTGDGEMRVSPGVRSKSVLYNILTGDLSSSWNYDHSAEITDYNILELIGNWIDNGAIY